MLMNNASQIDVYIESKVGTFVQLEEFSILEANDFNLSLPVGSSILKMALKLSNDTYDFSKFQSVVNFHAIEAIFKKFESSQVRRQSSIFFGYLKLTCLASNLSQFYEDFVGFLKLDHLSKIL